MTEIDSILKDAQSVAVSGHVRPDGDCVGSTLAVYNYIKDYYPNLKLENGKAQISNEEDLKNILYGLEERFYTTLISKEKRIANSITTAGAKKTKQKPKNSKVQNENEEN